MLVAVIFIQIFAIFAIMMVIVCEFWHEKWQIKEEEVIEEYSIKRNGKNIGILYVIKRTYVSGRIKIIEKRIYS